MSNVGLPSCGNPMGVAPGKTYSEAGEVVFSIPFEESFSSVKSNYESVYPESPNIDSQSKTFLMPKEFLVALPEFILGDKNKKIDEDREFLKAEGPWWWALIKILLDGVGKISSSIRTDKIEEWLKKRPIVQKAFAKSEFKKEFFELDDAKDFYDCVKKAKEMGYDGRDGLELSFKYLFSDSKKMQDQDFWYAENAKVKPFLTEETVIKLLSDGYEILSIDLAAQKAAGTLQIGEVPENVMSPIAKVRGLVDMLNKSAGFYEAVQDAMCLGFSRGRALELAFHYLFLIRSKANNDSDFHEKRGEWVENYLSVKSLKDLMTDVGFAPDEFTKAAKSASKYLGYDQIPETVMDPIALFNKQISPSAINQGLTDTQKLIKIQTGQKDAKEWKMMSNVLSAVLEEIKQGQLMSEGEMDVRFGPYKIKIEISDTSETKPPYGIDDSKNKSQALLVKDFESLLEAVKSGGPLTEGQQKTIEVIKSHPLIKQIVEMSTAACGNAIAGSEGYKLLLELAKVNKGVSSALWMMESKPEHAFGLVVKGQPFMDVLLKPSGFSKIPQVNILAPHYIGPYSFSEGEVFEVVGKTVEVSKAVTGWDQNGNRFYITENDFKAMGNLTVKLKAELINNPEIQKNPPARLKAFFQVSNDLWVVFKAVFRDIEVPEGTPKSVVTRAKAFKKINVGIRIMQAVEQLIAEFKGGASPYAGINGAELSAAAVEETLKNEIEKLNSEFGPKFRGGIKAEWSDSLNQLIPAIQSGDSQKISEAKGILELAVMKHIASGKASKFLTPYLDFQSKGPRTLAFPKEISAWFEEINVVKGQGVKDPDALFIQNLINGNLSSKLDKFVVARGLQAESRLEPSLEMAEEYAKAGAVDKAFAEYERLISEWGVDPAVRMTALAQMVKLAIKTYKFHRVKAGLDALGKMVSQGAQLGGEEIAFIKSMVEFEGKAFPIKVPPILKAAVGNEIKDINWYEVRVRWNNLPSGVKKEVSDVMLKWKTKLAGKEYSENFLKTVAVCNSKELMKLIETLYPENVSIIYNNLEKYYGEARPVVEGALNVGKKVTMPISLAEVAKKAGEAGALFVVSVDGDVKMPAEMRLPYIKDAKNFINTSVGVVGPAFTGALTFLISKDIVSAILPEPKYSLEAQVQGYSIMTLAMVADHGMYKGADYFLSKSAPGAVSAIPEAFSYSKFFGNLGSAIIAYRSLAGTLELLGVDPQWSEFSGLVGVGVVYGGWKPLLTAIKPALAAELGHSSALIQGIEAAGGEVLASKLGSKVSNAGMYINRFSLVYLLMDAGLGIADGLVSDTSDPIISYVREQEYQSWLYGIEQSSYFAETTYMNSAQLANYTDIPWYEKLGNSAHRLVENLVPAGNYKILKDIFGSDWRDQQIALIEEAEYYNGPYSKALMKAWTSAAEMHNWFNEKIGDAIWKQDPPKLKEIFSVWSEKPKTSAESSVAYAFTDWQLYADENLRPEDENWLFKTSLVDNGVWKDEGGLAYWMKAYFFDTLNIMEEFLVAEMKFSEDIFEQIEIQHAIDSIKSYKVELSLMITAHIVKWAGKEIPKPLPLLNFK